MTAPDMTRVYVVERLPLVRTAPGETAPQPQDWLCVGQYDDPAEAGSHASSLRPTVGTLNAGIRVRQFWVQSHRDPVPQTGTKPAPLPYDDRDLLDMACVDHPTRTAKAYKNGEPGRCPDCRRTMVPVTMLTDDITNLEDVT